MSWPDAGSSPENAPPPPEPPGRPIVVFTSDAAADPTAEALEALFRRWPERPFLVVEGGLKIRRSRYLRGKLLRLRREPLSYPLELATQAAGAAWRKLSPGRERSILGAPNRPADADSAPANVRYMRFEQIHGAESLAAVRAFGPWLGLSIGAPILREPLFGIPELGTINVHKSLLPNYRGMPPAFWEIHDGADKTGVSVHWVESTLDTGALIEQSEYPLEPTATPGGVRARLDSEACELLIRAIERIERDGRTSSAPQPTPDTPTRSRPPFLVQRSVQRRQERKRKSESWLRGVAKNMVQSGYARVLAPMRNWRRGRNAGCHTTILLYHRVSDRFLDSISVGVEQFDRHLGIIKQHYDVIDMATFLAQRGVKRTRPAVVLTFDDGYENNHLAARLLRRHGLPCTFFINTRIVGTDQRFPFDVEQGNHDVPALTWEQADEMARWGFDLANHTALHTNLAKADTASALQAIAIARDDLDARYGHTAQARWLAYPFGWQDDMTDEVRAELKSLDVDYCFSAYGGVNSADWDPLNIVRQGVAHAVSDTALRALIEGWVIRS